MADDTVQPSPEYPGLPRGPEHTKVEWQQCERKIAFDTSIGTWSDTPIGEIALHKFGDGIRAHLRDGRAFILPYEDLSTSLINLVEKLDNEAKPE